MSDTPLEDPGLPITLTVKVASDGTATTRYTLAPAEAAALLRSIAAEVEAQGRAPAPVPRVHTTQDPVTGGLGAAPPAL